MNLFTYLLLTIIWINVVCAINNTSIIPCNKYKLKNGRLRTKLNSKLVRFFCNKGYTLLGTKYGGCMNGKFDVELPLCVNSKPQCVKIKGLDNGWALADANNIIVHFFCKPEFKLIGSNITICDGNKWMYQLPNCISNNLTEPIKHCDFELGNMCGWSHDLNHDFDWKLMNLETPSAQTGPKFDHTKGKDKNGYYMYIESTSRLENDESRLISPIYPQTTTLCISFYYHMFGKDMGTLNVYLKHEKDTFEKLSPIFSESGNQGDFWNYAQISFENGTSEDYQIIFEGIRGTSYISDIAIDDIDISDQLCPEDENFTTEISDEDTASTPFFDSCLNRCGINDYEQNKCSCLDNCTEMRNCCADFIQICFLGTSVDYEVVDLSTTETSPEMVSTELETSSVAQNTTKQNLIIFKIITTTPSTTIKETVRTTMNKTVKPTTKELVKTTLATKKTKIIIKETKLNYITKAAVVYTVPTTVLPTSTPIVFVKKNASSSKTTEFNNREETTDDIKSSTLKIETDFVAKVQYLQQNSKTTPNIKPNNNLFIYIGAVASVALVSIIVVTIIFIKKKDLICAKFKSSRNNDSMSDVRFLASDEVLDFTWKRAESL